MNRIILCFHHELSRDFGLAGHLEYVLQRRASIKDILEAHGVPHTEIGCLLADTKEIGFEHVPAPGEKISILPVKAPVNVSRPTLLRPVSYTEVKFIVDVNAGKLAMLLRMLGQDTLWSNSYRDRDVAELAAREQRIVLSKDRGLLKRKSIVHGRLIRASDPDQQLREVVELYGLDTTCRFARCLRCNKTLNPVPKSQILHRLQPKTRKYFDHFEICPGCGRIYWKGSHWEKMCTRISRFV